jgi:hypothetical protein
MPEPCACHQEVSRLHRFFQDWFRGRAAVDFGMCERALAPHFTIITPTGQLLERGEILDAIRVHRGGEPPDFEITTVPRICQRVGGLHLSTYEEHQRGTRATVRLSTAVLAESDGVFTWHSLHETWLTTTEL